MLFEYLQKEHWTSVNVFMRYIWSYTVLNAHDFQTCTAYIQKPLRIYEIRPRKDSQHEHRAPNTLTQWTFFHADLSLPTQNCSEWVKKWQRTNFAIEVIRSVAPDIPPCWFVHGDKSSSFVVTYLQLLKKISKTNSNLTRSDGVTTA